MKLFETIERVQPTLPGWCCKEKAEALASIVIALRPSVSLEIGIWGGSSFIPIALAHKYVGLGVAMGIDPWNARDSVKNEVPENFEWWANQDHNAIREGFMRKLAELELGEWTRIFVSTSDAFSPPQNIDLLHIDGSHTEQAVRDVVRYATRVRVGGICVMDDLDWKGGNVKLAERRLLEMRFKMLYALGTGAVYQRV